MKKNIAVITGGEAAEVGIALKSAGVVCKHLDKEKYNVYKIVMQGNDWMLEQEGTTGVKIDKNDFTLNLNGNKIVFDCVFVAIHGTPAEDGKLQGYFDMLKIPYNCCGVLQAALTFDKARCKEYLSGFGIKSAKAVLLTKKDKANGAAMVNEVLQVPVFVKPNKNGSSYGASKVKETDKLQAAIDLAFEYDEEIIVEQYLSGTEVTSGVFIIDGKVTALPLTEIRSKAEFFDYEAKYEGKSEEVTPAEIDAGLTKKIQATSEFIYKKLDFKGMCRIDYIIMHGEYYMLEVNSVPGISEASIFPQQAAAVGISVGKLFEITIEEALKK
jgi:D-alanine-D-alanine ligase